MGCKSNRQLIVFTRFPEAGVTKTRLIPTLGADGAALLQRKMTEHTLNRIRQAHIRPEPAIEIRFEGADKKRMRAWLGGTYRYRSQKGDTLGDRMASAFESAFRRRVDQAALIGTDIPGLGPDTLKNAFDALGKANVVLGPASDGGYYLIGMQRGIFPIARRLFGNMPWGTDSVLSETLRMAAASGLSTRLLEKLTDIDDPHDLSVWEQEANHPL